MNYPPRVLIYTIAIDEPGSDAFRTMAKMLVASLLRTYFSGEILVLHNGDAPLFRVERKRVEERFISIAPSKGYSLKYTARSMIAAKDYDWICFLDCDMLAQRNVDHLFDPGTDCDILWQPEARMRDKPFNAYFRPEEYGRLWRYGANSGTWAVRGREYADLMEAWERVDCAEPVSTKICYDQPAWNRVLFDSSLRKRQLEKGEVKFPLLHDHSYMSWRMAALLHANGTPNAARLEFLMGQFLSRFAGEPPGVMLSLMEP